MEREINVCGKGEKKRERRGEGETGRGRRIGRRLGDSAGRLLVPQSNSNNSMIIILIIAIVIITVII